jgi:hypothetical protein
MDQVAINDTIRKTWTEQLQQKQESLTDSILNGFTAWVQNLVKQAAEQQAQQQTQQAQASGNAQPGKQMQGGRA